MGAVTDVTDEQCCKVLCEGRIGEALAGRARSRLHNREFVPVEGEGSLKSRRVGCLVGCEEAHAALRIFAQGRHHDISLGPP